MRADGSSTVNTNQKEGPEGLLTQEQKDVYWMRQAIAESRRGIYIAPPNPSVGCVIVRGDCEIARGYTHAPGSAHAEIDALNNAAVLGRSVEGATVYVTLEPCSHYGRTPPCALRLIKEKVGRVVAAIRDPNPLVAGRGLEMLAQAGIEVVCGVCAEQAREANIGFLTRMQRGTPWVRLKVAASLDGRTALCSGESHWITGPGARRAGQLLRARAQGLLTAIGTVLADNPQMNVRVEGDYPSPVKYVLDSDARTPPSALILTGRPCVIFVAQGGDERRARRVERLRQAGAQIRELPVVGGEDVHGSRRLDLRQALASIAADGVNELHVEAGARLNGAMLAAGLVDEIVAFTAPVLMGEGVPLAQLPRCEHMSEVERWRFLSVTRTGEDLMLVLRRAPQDAALRDA